MNRLFYGDNLDILKYSIEDNSIDLIYIDPPFNSKRSYNVLFESIDLSDTTVQKEAFADTWSNVVYIDEMNEIADLHLDLYKYLNLIDNLQISKGIVSYLTTMALRICYMHRKLKDTGSFYLHCDPTMSHYLKIVCDLIFGGRNFKNDISWCYEIGARSKKQWGKKHDIILFYTKTDKFHFDWKKVASPRKPNTHMKVGKDANGREYQEKIDVKTGKIYQYYLDEGVIPPDWWIIQQLNREAKERLGYPTQKPETLLERIIKASSNEGDVVADFFCGCGTAVAVAQRLNRKWIGVDISHLAVRLIKDRILKPYETHKDKYREIRDNIEINGFPKDIATAKELAQHTKQGRFKFQDWIIEIMLDGVSNPKRTADGGYDGYLTFYRSVKEKDIVLIEVKSGQVSVKNMREFVYVVNNKGASFAVFVCFEEFVTDPMRIRAKQEGYYEPDTFGNKYDKIQIVTVEDLLSGKSFNYPSFVNTTFKNAQKNVFQEPDKSTGLF